MIFELTNNERKYLGLSEVSGNWDLVEFNENTYVYFAGEYLKKRIIIKENHYFESELNFQSAENRTVLLPKTPKGKNKKLTASVIQNLHAAGTYFSFNQGVTIANFTNQSTYYSTWFEDEKYRTFEDLKRWLKQWIRESTEKDLKEIEKFSNSRVKHCKYKEGDFFRFKIGRRHYGFGRILLDVEQVRKQDTGEHPVNYGFSILMGKPLVVKLYHIVSDRPDIDIHTLDQLNALPSQYIMDNVFYYGECEIIGNLQLKEKDFDFPIQYGRSIRYGDEKTIYLQYGLIVKKSTAEKMENYIKRKQSTLGSVNSLFAHNSIGWSFNVKLSVLKECIDRNSNTPYWNNGSQYIIKSDLRNPEFNEERHGIFNFFGLDADKSYTQNLNKENEMNAKRNLFGTLFRQSI